MARNAYTLEGVALTDLAKGWFLDSDTGLRIIPAKRMNNLSYPGRDGEKFSSNSPFLPGGVSITMYVFGSTHEEFMTRVEYLNNLFLQRHKLLELRHDYNEAKTTTRYAYLNFNAAGDISTLGPGVKEGKVTYNGSVPGSFWRSASADAALAAVTTTPVTVTVPNLTGGNAPVSDALIRVSGAFNTLTITDFTTKDSLTINTPLAAGQYIIIDPANWTAYKVTTNTWTGGTDVSANVISNRGSGSQFTMEPSLSGTAFLYRITQSASAPTGAVVEVRARKAFL